MRRRPLVYRLFYGRRLYHKLEGRLEVDLQCPVEGGPHRAPLPGLLIEDLPQRGAPPVLQWVRLWPHEKTPLLLQAPDPKAILLQAGAQLVRRILLPAVELDQQPAPRLPHPEEGRVQPTQDVYVLGYAQHVVGHAQEGVELADERPRRLAPLEE